MLGGDLVRSSAPMPSALAPDEDQGYVIAIAALPPAASLQRTEAVLKQLDQAAFAQPGVRGQFHRQRLRRADERPAQQRRRQLRASSRTGRSGTTRRCRRQPSRARCSAPAWGSRTASSSRCRRPPIEGLSNTGGFEGFVQARTGNDYAALEAATQKLIAAAAKRPELTGVGTSYSARGAARAGQHGRREGEAARREHRRRERHAAEHVRRALRERLQSQRPRVSRADAVGRRVPRASGGSARRVRALGRRHDGAAHGGRDGGGDHRAGRHRALQPVSVRAPVRRAGAGLQLGAGARGDGGGRGARTCRTATRSRGRGSRSRRRPAARTRWRSSGSPC